MCMMAAMTYAQESKVYKLANQNGMEALITTEGGRVVSLKAPNWNGRMENVISEKPPRQQLPAMTVESADNNRITLRNEDVKITYTLTDQNALDIDILNYGQNSAVGNVMINIGGDPSRNILAQHLWIDCKKFKKARQLSAYHKELAENGSLLQSGFAHTFQLLHPGNNRKPAVIMYDTQSGRALTVYTTAPAVRLYSYPGLDGVGFAPQSSATRTKLVFKFTTDPPVIAPSQM